MQYHLFSAKYLCEANTNPCNSDEMCFDGLIGDLKPKCCKTGTVWEKDTMSCVGNCKILIS